MKLHHDPKDVRFPGILGVVCFEAFVYWPFASMLFRAFENRPGMMLLPIYAVLTWYFCFRFRRQLLGWLALGVSLMLIALVMVLEQRIRTWVGAGENPFTSLQFILWGEVIIVGVGGAFILCLRKGGAEVPCRKCGYELVGLEVENPRCPECGQDEAAFRPDREPPRHIRSARQRLRSQYTPPTSRASAAGPAITPILQR